MAGLQDGAEIEYAQQAHKLKLTKQQAGIYLTCCGDEIQHYTSSEFGCPASDGWYITRANGSFDADRFLTLADVKSYLARFHDTPSDAVLTA